MPLPAPFLPLLLSWELVHFLPFTSGRFLLSGHISHVWVLLFLKLEQISQRSLTLQHVFWLGCRFQVGRKKNEDDLISDTFNDWHLQHGCKQWHDSFSWHLFFFFMHITQKHWPEKELLMYFSLCNCKWD